MWNQKIKILIVDDDLVFSKKLAQIIEKQSNYEVKLVKDKKSCIALLLNETFHLVFLNCIFKSQQKDGINIRSEIKKHLGESVEIVMMSSMLQESTIVSYINTRKYKFLHKSHLDSELNVFLKEIEHKIKFKDKFSFLEEIFRKTVSSIDRLKQLVNLKNLRHYEIFIYIKNCLMSKDNLKLEIKLKNKKHILFFDKGHIVNYQNETTYLFLNKLFANKIITKNEVQKVKELNQKECEDYLLQNCILSVKQIIDTKYDLINEMLQALPVSSKIPVSISLNPEKNLFFQICNQSEYADMVFPILKKNFHEDIFSLGNETFLNKHLVFESNIKDSLKELKNFVDETVDGMKLHAVYKKYKYNKQNFYLHLLYTLFKGDVYFSESSQDRLHQYLFERYTYLLEFVTKSDAKDLFNALYSKPEQIIDPKIVKNIYFEFIKNNHTDQFPKNFSKKLLELINSVISKVHDQYQICSDPKLQLQMYQQSQNLKNNEEFDILEKKNSVKKLIKQNKYQDAFNIIQSVSKKVIEKDNSWKIFYLFLNFTDSTKFYLKNTEHYFISIKKEAYKLKSNKLYYYVMALHYEKQKDYNLAQKHFMESRSIDPNFFLAYSGISRCIKQLKNKNKSALYKWISDLNKSKKSG